MAGFMYPRTIDIHRPAGQAGVGALGYGGQTVATEAVLATGIRCSIQMQREGQRNPTGLPGDGKQASHFVFIPKAALALGAVRSRDILIDDQGRRYQVIDPYFDSLGHRLSALVLEA